MQQKVLIAAPISLFEVVDGTAIERGNCACAIVAAATSAGRPRYSIVCYNDRRETLCVASISSSLEQSVQFQLNTDMYASFRDGVGKYWKCAFLSGEKQKAFLAALGIATYALAGRPTHSAHTSDFMPVGVDIRLQQHNRARVHYTAYAVRGAELPLLGDLLESNGEELYCFRPVASTAALLQGDFPDAYGFESGVIGMGEGSTRVIVVPAAALPHGRRNMYGADGAAFVVQLINILQDETFNMESDGVPTVMTVGDDLVVAEEGSGALIVPTSEGSSGGNVVAAVVPFSGTGVVEAPGALSAQRSSAVEPGAGVPEGHMEILQRLGLLLNGAVENSRTVRSISEATAAEWRRAINRPKPSRLTNAALLEAVQQLVMESDRVADSISQRDGLIRELDRRNQEMQRRVDSAVLASQELLDEKNKCTRTASDVRLEGERAIMQVQQQINQAAMERDDAQRHLQTVKQLLQVSETELRDLRSTSSLNTEETNRAASALNNLQDALSEERSRRKALEATIATLQEQLSRAKTELHVKNGQLEDIRRAADMQRTQHAQVVEDERQRRAMEVQQLRTEFITELQAREAKFMADRARTSEENFRRGQAEGRSIGKAESRGSAAEHRQQELALEAQRLLAELNCCRADLRQAAEDGIMTVRTTGARAARLNAQLHEENFRRGRLEMLVSNARGRLQGGRDKIMAAFAALAHRLRRPVKVSDLLALLEDLRKRRPLNFSFQEREYLAELASATRRRFQWIEEATLMLYKKSLEELYNGWLLPLQTGYESTAKAVYALMIERDGEALCEFNTRERQGRFDIVMQMEDFFNKVTLMFKGEAEQRQQLFVEAERLASTLLEKFAEDLSALEARWSAELEERQLLRRECARGYAVLLLKEEAEFHSIVMDATTSVHIADQNDLIATESGVRNAIDSEECAELSGLLFDYENEKSLVTRIAAIAAEQRSLVLGEGEMRACIVSEEETTLQIVIDMFAEYIPSLRPAPDTDGVQEGEEVPTDGLPKDAPNDGEVISSPPAVTTLGAGASDPQLSADDEGPPPVEFDEPHSSSTGGCVPPPAPLEASHSPPELDGPPPIDNDDFDGPPPIDNDDFDGPPPVVADNPNESPDLDGPPPIDNDDFDGPPPVVADNPNESPDLDGPPPIDNDDFDGPPPVVADNPNESPDLDGPPPIAAEALQEDSDSDGPPPITDESLQRSAEVINPPVISGGSAAGNESSGSSREGNSAEIRRGEAKPPAQGPPAKKVPQRKLPTFDSSDSDW
ncbi:hypothetical protein, conserved [Trypanosoma brucei gambiense DAL972]|uniref:Uncharacterized protein n=1 Tax=Trypanosoma brucei gambiense (strain MHOM/CI/86/DAL972) TaxID=679716 RepID=C9ZQI4_TRYB9|nr:hypothetical protein, conserved [Trypanosoma brucei gambiense DAL972]CBH11664.1 hypothetical protein, conserved [Trypanosoma brucei gambiense DAL972]|eukprot:XP_011773949.1 hypothetical protein, conserved [Trypanosoma brucei gambiense DAL972]